MNGMLIKKLNQILNFKNVRCSKCDRFVNFITHKSSDTYGVMDFDFFDCECGLKKHDIDNVAYVTTKIGERIDLLDYLKLSKLMDDKEDSTNDLYLKLDMVDSKLQDRNKASQDVQSSLDLNMEDIINNYENILKAKFEKDFSCSMEDVIRRIVSYQEIDGEYEIELKNKSPWFSSQEWEWIETEIDNLNG
ncbi:MAG: hypothetical protein IJH34_07950, partial [Romboutsia sp.]|nr:hypothetical protein [Romboutsia sp.]